MALFESATEQGVVDLSDDALFAEAGEEAVDQDSNDNGSQGVENAPAEISTEEPSEQQVEAKAEEANKEPENKAAEAAAQSKREREALAGMTKAMRDRAETQRELEAQRQQNALLQKQLEQMRVAVQQVDPNKRKEALEQLTSNPMEFINTAAQPIIANEVMRAVEAHLKPIREAEAQRAQTGEMAKAIQYLQEKGYAQASDSSQLRELVTTMATLDPDWKNHPGTSLKLAALEAWGTPKVINQKLIDEAEERGKQKAIAEFNKRDADKAKVPPVPTQASAGKTEEYTPEDEILAGIVSAGPTRLFQ